MIEAPKAIPPEYEEDGTAGEDSDSDMGGITPVYTHDEWTAILNTPESLAKDAHQNNLSWLTEIPVEIPQDREEE